MKQFFNRYLKGITLILELHPFMWGVAYVNSINATTVILGPVSLTMADALIENYMDSSDLEDYMKELQQELQEHIKDSENKEE